MTEAEWLACSDPTPMLQKVLLHGTARRRKARLFGCAACRRIWALMNDDCRKAVEVSEQYADGLIAARELDLLWRRVAGEVGDYTRGDRKVNVARAALDSSSLSLATPLLVGAINAIIKILPNRKKANERTVQVALVHDIFGNPFRPVFFSPDWRTSTALALASQMYDSRDFSAMPILADALQDAGCDNEDILSHCRDCKATHVRGCWVVDLALAKE